MIEQGKNREERLVSYWKLSYNSTKTINRLMLAGSTKPNAPLPHPTHPPPLPTQKKKQKRERSSGILPSALFLNISRLSQSPLILPLRLWSSHQLIKFCRLHQHYLNLQERSQQLVKRFTSTETGYASLHCHINLDSTGTQHGIDISCFQMSNSTMLISKLSQTITKSLFIT